MRACTAIQEDVFDLNAEITALAKGGVAGAVASFTGHVRDESGLSSLTLEHYPEMTEGEIAHIVQEAATRWPLTGVTMIHRIGALAPAKPSSLSALQLAIAGLPSRPVNS